MLLPWGTRVTVTVLLPSWMRAAGNGRVTVIPTSSSQAVSPTGVPLRVKRTVRVIWLRAASSAVRVAL